MRRLEVPARAAEGCWTRRGTPRRNTPASESAKWQRENAKYVKYPKTSGATLSEAAAAAVKVAAHNKEVKEWALTSQWLSCPAAGAPLLAAGCLGVLAVEFLPRNVERFLPAQKQIRSLTEKGGMPSMS